MFLLPFDLIQVQGYSATAAGAVFLPFTAVMAILSRWSGGLLDRFGARLPLVVGPSVTAIGFALLALPGANTPYWSGFLLPSAVLGLGMAVTVAPLTTQVINAVPPRQTGVASGVNNAVASVASLLAVAIFGAVALGGLDRAITRDLAAPDVSPAARQALDGARGKFVIEADAKPAEAAIKDALGEGMRLGMLLAAALALVGAASALAMIRSDARSDTPRSS
jgi:MFS family permease